jgi:AhpD family alkylhydroperoxidase
MNGEQGLTQAARELIVATSALNNCLYCVVSHNAFTRLRSKNPIVADQVAIDWREANLSPRENAIIEWCYVSVARERSCPPAAPTEARPCRSARRRRDSGLGVLGSPRRPWVRGLTRSSLSSGALPGRAGAHC